MRTENLSAQIAMPEANPKLIGFAESDIRARPFKLLRTMLTRQLVDERCNVIGITSPSPNAGKSFLASNLAAAMGRIANNDVLLVDLDLQRASIAEVFELEDLPGVTEYLIGKASGITDIARHVEGTNLTIFPALTRSSNSAELLASERFASLMDGLKAYGEKPTIICDLPPLFVNDDAMLVARHLDGVILVVEQGVTTKKQLEASLQILYPTKLLGTVFNRYSGSFGDPYGYSAAYGSYY